MTRKAGNTDVLLPDKRKRKTGAQRTQAERSSRTRRVTCEAVLDLLFERGWDGVSSHRVAERAKISRGALVHQYPTRNDMYVAAYQYLIDTWRNGYPFNTGPEYVRLSMEEMIDAIWKLIYEDKWFIASIELILVGDKDSELSRRLLEVFSNWVNERDAAVLKILGIEPGDKEMTELFQLTLATLRGVALFNKPSGEPDYARRHVARWKVMARAAMDAVAPTDATTN